MRTVPVYVQSGAGMAADGWSAAWTFDLDLWGTCGQGPDDAAAVADLLAQVRARLARSHVPAPLTDPPGEAREVVGDVVEHLVSERTGAELAFERDRVPCSPDERRATLHLLATARAETLAFRRALPERLLDVDDPGRVLPGYARWRTLRQMLWHVPDTESRYYLPRLGLEPLPRARTDGHDDLDAELAASARHVAQAVASMAADLHRVDPEHGEWTSTKVLRRLAWHERGELVAMRRLAQQVAALEGGHEDAGAGPAVEPGAGSGAGSGAAPGAGRETS